MGEQGMKSVYTPTTDQVRKAYENCVVDVWDTRSPGTEFDLWLATDRNHVAKIAASKERERILEELRTILLDSDVIDFYYDHINFDELDRQIRGYIV